MWHRFSIWYGGWQYGETRNDLELRMLAMAWSFRDISRGPLSLCPLTYPTYLIRAQGNKRREMFSINLILRMTVVLYYRMEGPIASSRSPSLFFGRRANRSWSGFPSPPSSLFTTLEFCPGNIERLNFSIVWSIMLSPLLIAFVISIHTNYELREKLRYNREVSAGQ